MDQNFCVILYISRYPRESCITHKAKDPPVISALHNNNDSRDNGSYILGGKSVSRRPSIVQVMHTRMHAVREKLLPSTSMRLRHEKFCCLSAVNNSARLEINRRAILISALMSELRSHQPLTLRGYSLNDTLSLTTLGRFNNYFTFN